MKTNPLIVRAKTLLLLFLGFLQLPAIGQDWYQNQDGNNIMPYGTYAAQVQRFSSSSFIASYMWFTDNDQYTWKISRTNHDGLELKTFFITGTMTEVKVKTGNNQAVYVIKKDYPAGQDPVFTLLKLNTALEVVKQQVISLGTGTSLTALHVLELDNKNNVYLAGDAMHQPNGTPEPVSFIMKTDKDLTFKWSKLDTTASSYTALHIDSRRRVIALAEHPSIFPAVKISRFSASGNLLGSITVNPDANRYSLYAALGKDDKLVLYGGKTVNDTSQAVYCSRVSPVTGNITWSKTYFTSLISQMYDFKMDDNGRIFILTLTYNSHGNQFSNISRINPSSGHLLWNRPVMYDTDSCIFSKLVMAGSDRLFAVGEKRTNTYFAKGFALRIKKSGQTDGSIAAPDSAGLQRFHTLTDGIADNQQRLIVIGNTNDFDTTTYTSTYYRAFAARLNEGQCSTNTTTAMEAAGDESAIVVEKTVLYPNPVQNQLTVSNMNPEEYDKLQVFDMRGAVVMQQKVTASVMRLDASGLTDGVYLLVLRSSASFKEKTIKFIVRK